MESDKSHSLVVIYKIDQQIVWANNEYLKISDLDLGTIQKKVKFTIWDVKDFSESPVAQAIKTGINSESYLKMRKTGYPSDSDNLWHVKAVPTKNEQGKIIQVIEKSVMIEPHAAAESSPHEPVHTIEQKENVVFADQTSSKYDNILKEPVENQSKQTILTGVLEPENIYQTMFASSPVGIIVADLSNECFF